MPRYIDTDEFEKRIKPYDTNDTVDKALYNFARNKIAETPTADVRENVHGKWKHGYCSECGYNWGKGAPIASVPNFCPNCGADMREGERRCTKVRLK